MLKEQQVSVFMKAILVYNEEAGFKGTSQEEVKEALEREGFTTSSFSLQDEQFARLKQQECDLVVAVGGDGTVKAVALQLAGSKLPMGIWPEGTANNIANSYGISKETSFRSVISQSLQQLKAGEVSLKGDTYSFMESAGVGMLACMMHEMIHRVVYTNEQEKLNKSILLLLEYLRNKKEYQLDIRLDGESLSGSYLAVEVLNVRYTGPKLLLASQRKPGSKRFDVVLISRSQAELLEAYFSDRLAGLQRPPQLLVYPAEKISLRGSGLDFHVDDTLFQLKEETVITIQPAEQETLICCNSR